MERWSVQKDTLSWLWTSGLDFSRHFTLSAGGLCTVRNLRTLTRQAGLVHLIVATLLDCLVHCWSQRGPLRLISPSPHSHLLHENGFFCCWILWLVLSLLWFLEACYLVLLLVVTIYTHMDMLDALRFPIIHLNVWTSFFLPSAAWNKIGLRLRDAWRHSSLGPGLPKKCRPAPSRLGPNAMPCNCLKIFATPDPCLDCVYKDLGSMGTLLSWCKHICQMSLGCRAS